MHRPMDHFEPVSVSFVCRKPDSKSKIRPILNISRPPKSSGHRWIPLGLEGPPTKGPGNHSLPQWVARAAAERACTGDKDVVYIYIYIFTYICTHICMLMYTCVYVYNKRQAVYVQFYQQVLLVENKRPLEESACQN